MSNEYLRCLFRKQVGVYSAFLLVSLRRIEICACTEIFSVVSMSKEDPGISYHLHPLKPGVLKEYWLMLGIKAKQSERVLGCVLKNDQHISWIQITCSSPNIYTKNKQWQQHNYFRVVHISPLTIFLQWYVPTLLSALFWTLCSPYILIIFRTCISLFVTS